MEINDDTMVVRGRGVGSDFQSSRRFSIGRQKGMLEPKPAPPVFDVFVGRIGTIYLIY